MTANPQKSYWTEAEYLAFEDASDTKYEYFAGEIRAMVGATRNHNLIATNITRLLGNQLLDRPCENYQGDMAVQIQRQRAYYYPDHVVVCDAPQFAEEGELRLTNPTVIFEVLSPSTSAFDRGEKLWNYQTIPSLQHYVIVAQERAFVEMYSRGTGAEWLYLAINEMESVIDLSAIDCQLKLAEVYAKVNFETEDASEGSPSE
jgi:Uma2 family endonuclease